MAGHSKWANIKHRKAAVDAKRGKIFTRISKEITIAAKLGGGDADSNPRLRLAIQNARAASMPRDNIDRAIKRGTGELGGDALEEVRYEGYGPGGVAVIVEATTDNKKRTVPQIRAIFSKYDGNLGENNSVSWNFTQAGEVKLKTDKSEDELFEVCIEAGADNVEMIEEGAIVTCAPDMLGNVGKSLEDAGLEVSEQKFVHLPNQTIEVTDVSHAKKLIKLLDAFDDNDDVQDVFNNAEIDDALLEGEL